MLRVLERKRISDRVPIIKMLENQKMLSFKQMAALIKLVKVWQTKNEENYPVKMVFRTAGKNETRGATSGKAVELGRTHKAKATFIGDAMLLWNKV